MRRLITSLAASITLITAFAPASASAIDSTISTVATTDDVGSHTATVMMANGFPLIASLDQTNSEINLVACLNANCSDTATNTISTTNNRGDFDMALGSDHRPVIVYPNRAGVFVTKCSDMLCTSETTQRVAGEPGDYVSTYYDVSIDVRSDNTPMIAYTWAYWSTAEVRVVSCRDTTCKDKPVTRAWGGALAAISSDLAVDGKDRGVMIWADGAENDARLVRCANQHCTSATSTLVDTNFANPAIAASGKRVSVVGITPSGGVRKIDCASSCGSSVPLSGYGEVMHDPVVTFVGAKATVVSFTEPATDYLYVADCPLSCGSAELAAKDSGRWTSIVDVGTDVYVAYQQKRGRDLGLAFITRG